MDKLREKIEAALTHWSPIKGKHWDLELEMLHPDASARFYVRVKSKDLQNSIVAMILSDEHTRFSEYTVNKPMNDELPFVNLQHYLSSIGVRVPHIYLYDKGLGLVLLEDLGDRILERELTRADISTRERVYRKAIDLLVHMQAASQTRSDPQCIAFSRAFEFDVVRWELNHFLKWFVKEEREVKFSQAEQEVVNTSFDTLAEKIAKLPRVFVHRDFQSRNLLIKEAEFVVIDFQDALLGPVAYDLVALLRDSYSVIDSLLLDRLIMYYLQCCKDVELKRPGSNEFKQQFDWVTVQRKLKDAGRFVYLDKVKGKSNFLDYIPTSLEYARQAFERLPEMNECQEVLSKGVKELR